MGLWVWKNPNPTHPQQSWWLSKHQSLGSLHVSILQHDRSCHRTSAKDIVSFNEDDVYGCLDRGFESTSMCEITYTLHYLSVTMQNQTKEPCFCLNSGGFWKGFKVMTWRQGHSIFMKNMSSRYSTHLFPRATLAPVAFRMNGKWPRYLHTVNLCIQGFGAQAMRRKLTKAVAVIGA